MTRFLRFHIPEYKIVCLQIRHNMLYCISKSLRFDRLEGTQEVVLMEDNFEQGYGVVIWELMQALKERIALILVATVAAAALGWGISAFFVPKQYEASVNMIVNTRTDLTTMVTSDNISSAQNLVDTYAIIIKSNKVLNKVIDELKLPMNYGELYRQNSVDAIDRTQVMKIAAQCDDPRLAEQIVHTISQIAPAIVADAVEAGSCKVVSDVYSSREPVSPNILRTAVLFAALAFLLVCAAVVLRELLNDYIVDDADMEKKLGISALGVIPDVED